MAPNPDTDSNPLPSHKVVINNSPLPRDNLQAAAVTNLLPRVAVDTNLLLPTKVVVDTYQLPKATIKKSPAKKNSPFSYFY